MSRAPVKNKQLAKLREFRKGMDVEDFLATEFRQVLRALKYQYVDSSQNYAESLSCGSTFSTTSTAEVTNLVVKLKTSGGKIRIGLKSDGVLAGHLGSSSAGASTLAYFHILQDDLIIASHQVSGSFTGTTNASVTIPSSSFSHEMFSLAAGEYTFKVSAQASGGTAVLRNSILYAYEYF